MAAVTIDELQIRINGSSTNAYASVDALITALEKLQRIRLDGGIAQSIDNIGKAASKATSRVSKMAKAFSDSAKNAVDIPRSWNWQYQPNWIPSGRQHFETPWWQIAQQPGTDITPYDYRDLHDWAAIDGTFEDITNKFYAPQEAVRDMFSNLNQPMDSTFQDKLGSIVAQIQSVLNPALEGLRNVCNKLDGALLRVGQAGLHGLGKLITMPFHSLTDKIKGTVGAFKKLASSIARIAMYRLLRTAIKEITQGFNEGIKAVSRYSRSIGGEFSQTMDKLTSQLALLKGSLGAMAAPLIEMLAPAIMTVTNAVITLANAINQVLSMLAGKSTWTKATNAVQKYDDSVGGAASNTQKLTASIDELNVLNDSSSGGGSGSSASYDFEQVAFADWVKDIKSLIEAGDWMGAGEELANKLNSIIDNWDAADWGARLGEKIQHGIELSYGFWKTIDTETLGNKVATFINNALEHIDTYMLGETLGEKWNRIVDFLYGLSTWLDWVQLADKITDWVRGAVDAFDPKKLSDTVNALVNGLLTFVAELVRTFPLSEMIQSFFDFFNGIDWYNLGLKIGQLTSELIRQLVGALCTLIENHPISSLISAFTRMLCGMLDGINWTLIRLYLDKLVYRMLTYIDGYLAWGIPALIESAISGENTGEVIQRMMEDSYDDGLALTNQLLNRKLAWIDEDIAAEYAKMDAAAEAASQSLVSHAEEAGAGIEAAVENTSNNTKANVGEAVAYVYDEVNGCMTRIGSVLDDGSQVVSNSAQQMGNSFAQPWSQFQELGDKAEELSSKASTSYEKIQEVASTSWTQIKNTTESDWKEIQEKVESTWQQLEDKATERFGNINTTITEQWEKIKSDTTEKWGIMGSIPSALKDGLATVEASFTSLETTISSTLTRAYASIDTFVSKALTRLNELINKAEQNGIELSEVIADGDIVNDIGHYATGGVVSSGNLFYANENGMPELVGSIGNTTTVMNNDQIVSAVSVGVYDAVLAAMSQSNGKSQSIQVFLNGKQIEASTRETRQRRGAAIATGGIYNFA